MKPHIFEVTETTSVVSEEVYRLYERTMEEKRLLDKRLLTEREHQERVANAMMALLGTLDSWPDMSRQ